jgi:hypothetical protein
MVDFKRVDLSSYVHDLFYVSVIAGCLSGFSIHVTFYQVCFLETSTSEGGEGGTEKIYKRAECFG